GRSRRPGKDRTRRDRAGRGGRPARPRQVGRAAPAMNTPARSRSRAVARLAAVQALYQREMEATPVTRLLNEFHQHRLGREIEDAQYAEAEVDFFDDVVRGVDARQEEIDAHLSERLAQGWSLA